MSERIFRTREAAIAAAAEDAEAAAATAIEVTPETQAAAVAADAITAAADLPDVIAGVENAIDSKAAAKAAADAAVIEKAADAKAKMSRADATRLARILREMTDADLNAHLTAVKGKRTPLASAARTERDRRSIAKAKADVAETTKATDKPATKATKPAADKPARTPAVTDETRASIVAMWNETTTVNARTRRAEIANTTGLHGKIAGILRAAGLDPDTLPNQAQKAEEAAE